MSALSAVGTQQSASRKQTNKPCHNKDRSVNSSQRSSEEVVTLSDFRLRLFVDSIVDICASKSGLNKEELVSTICASVSEHFTQLEALETLQRIYNAKVTKPTVSFKESGLKYDSYLREHFAENIENGFLPIGKIDDKDLRRRVSIEKDRKRFPEDLDAICLTGREVLHLRRQCAAVVMGPDDPDSHSFITIARSLVPKALGG